MTLIEFLFAVVAVGMIVLQCVILLELRADRVGRGLRESQRRTWVKQEHEG